MALPEVRVTPDDNGAYSPRTVLVDLKLPSGEVIDITTWVTRLEQLGDERGGWRAAKITIYAHTDLPSAKEPLVLDANA